MYKRQGQAYHQQAIIQLAQGWNPLHDPPLPTTVSHALFVNCYPKAAWLMEAVSYKLTGSIESGKALGVLLLLCAILIGNATFQRIGLTRWQAMGMATLLALNPVALAQSSSFYVDGILGSTLLIGGYLCVLWLLQPRTRLLVLLAGTGLLLINLKFTGALFFGATTPLFVLLARRLHPRQFRYTLYTCAGTLLLGVFVVGANPYLSNLSRHGHPLFPLRGHHAIDLSPQGPAREFQQHNRFSQLAISLFAEASNSPGATPQLKLPLSIRPRELSALAAPDTRIAGFGPLFGPSLLIAFGLLALAGFYHHPRFRAVLLLTAIALGSSLVLPTPYWARYVPQLYLIAPLSVLLCSGFKSELERNHSILRWSRYGGLVLCVLLTLNLAVVAGVSVGSSLLGNLCRRNQLAQLAKQPEPIEIDFHGFDSNRLLLQAARIRYQQTTALHCPNPQPILMSEARYCLTNGESPLPQPSQRDQILDALTRSGLTPLRRMIQVP